jgi:hypothetical protein
LLEPETEAFDSSVGVRDCTAPEELKFTEDTDVTALVVAAASDEDAELNDAMDAFPEFEAGTF